MVISGLAYVVIGLSVVVLGWGGFSTVAKRAISWPQLIAAGVLELSLLVQSVIAGVKLATGSRVAENATTIGYLIGVVVLLPVGALWALGEKSRWAGMVLGVAAFATGAMTLRLLNLWGVTGA